MRRITYKILELGKTILNKYLNVISVLFDDQIKSIHTDYNRHFNFYVKKLFVFILTFLKRLKSVIIKSLVLKALVLQT